ncbi:polysaccharide deacetylase family protein [Autumnicola musiva]|uniref:Polysaccharide deacetylase family protein n=1 Tax=Autumnicola musiva TaxID=3075589 RepID=A0ABU3D721_9FLAO|nr:polysaccharide deacetylase family protein [Zunongwangia sp. F117]MDT0677337.1 polysaccharide deacetylase family protein [Zunongwangia sp. F117]
MTFRIINTVIILLLLIVAVVLLFNDLSVAPVVAFAIIYILFLLVVSTNIRFNFFVKAHHNNPVVSEKKIALSFDDGPVENTLRILDILDKFQVKTIFFCIGKNVKKHPEILQEIIARGHIIGNHSYTHTRKMGFLKAGQVLEEIRSCDEIVHRVTGLKMNLFRPPFGVINPKTKRALKITGHKVIGWRVRSYDAILNSEEIILKRIKKKLKSGDVVLLHDNKPVTAEVLEQLLIYLQKHNFQVVRADNLFDIDAYT